MYSSKSLTAQILASRNPVGRPFLYGAVVSGQAGIEQVIKDILAELDITLGLSGYKNLDEIRGKRDEVLYVE